MTHTPDADRQDRARLQSIARRAMVERGLLPSFSPEVMAEVQRTAAAAGVGADSAGNDASIRDLRHLIWASHTRPRRIAATPT